MSLGASVRVAVDLPGWAPILLDRWEFDAMSAKTKEGEHFRRAVAIRSLARELKVALETKETIEADDVGEIPRVVAELGKSAREAATFLTRTAESADSAHQRRYLLTRDNMARELDAVVELCQRHEIAVEVAPPLTASNLPKSRTSTVTTFASSASGAYERTKESVQDTSKVKVALLAVLFLAAVGIASFNLRPRPDNREHLNAASYQAIVPVVKLWKKGNTVCGVVTDSWFKMSKGDQEAKIKAAYEKAKKEEEASVFALYEPGGAVITAVATGDRIELRSPAS